MHTGQHSLITTFFARSTEMIVSSFGNDKDGDSQVLDFDVFCLRYDDIVHKEDSIGYMFFLTPGFYVSICTEPPKPPIQNYSSTV
jgi:hypothetical protein